MRYFAKNPLVPCALLSALSLWQCSSTEQPPGGSDTGGSGPAGGTAGVGGTSTAGASGVSGAATGGTGQSGAAGSPLGGAGGFAATGPGAGNAGVGDAGGGGFGNLGGVGASAGAATGGVSGAGATAGGGAGGAGGTGGSGGTLSASFFIGADITNLQAAEARGATFSDGTQQDIFQLLKGHGFNYIRLRIFVDPRAADGYDKTNGYADLAHTITFGRRIKQAGMGFLLDFHYSDNWADPGKQCVPVAWQGFTTVAQMATAVHDYTRDAITQLVAGGARPDMVQVGNEITPGMLIHRCDSGGQPTGTNPVSGSASSWTNLGTLLKAGVQGVKDVDTGILIMLHIDRGNNFAASRGWIDNAIAQAVPFDVFGESCYQAYQGDPSSVPNTVNGWTTTFAQLVARYPNIKFVAAEYGPLQREINDVLFNLPNQQGIGTFNWEPATSGSWNTGHALFSRNGNTYTTAADMALYDLMKTAYAARL